MRTPRRKTPAQPRDTETVGDRIRRLRKLRGLSQTELGKRVGLSQRLMTYYEAQGGSLSAELLVRFAEALEVSADEILGIDGHATATDDTPRSVRMWRRLRRIEDLPVHDRKTIMKLIDTLAGRAEEKRR